jgi:hypothetical protein
VKKEDQNITLLETDVSSNKDFKKDSYKTTNVNILLNRVRLDKKRSFKKRIIISFFLVSYYYCFDCLLYYLAKLHLKSILKQ